MLHKITYAIVGIFYAFGMTGKFAGKFLYTVIKGVLSLFVR